MSCSFKLTQHRRAPTRSAYVYRGLVASVGNLWMSCAGNLWMSCVWCFWYMVTFRSPLVRSVALSTPGHWVSVCSENAVFITQIWVKHHLLLKLKLHECTNLSNCYKIISVSGHPIMKILITLIIYFTVSDVSNCNMLEILSLTDKTFLKDFN